ncbi:hypothetical protein GCM10023063_01080 [Arthrobacter methylotrophus]|uniref:Uncharacterized protein n=1 Tax=Arthrobacter methylotrophus TaxID=121291 RepID=A0ABV5ULQ9_9MICC
MPVFSPFESSEDRTQASWQANEVTTAFPSDPEMDSGNGVRQASNGLEIDFLEVADGSRRQGLGTQTIRPPRWQHSRPSPVPAARE